jgi:hypothetical protein
LEGRFDGFGLAIRTSGGLNDESEELILLRR